MAFPFTFAIDKKALHIAIITLWKEICFDDLYVVEKNREEKKIEEDTEREDLKRRIPLRQCSG